MTCPTCGSKAVYFDKTLNGWKCKTKHPRQKFTLKTGSIFEDSPLGFDKWLPAVWMVTNCKNGISSYEIDRDIGVTQKTAWFMLQRIRLAMQDPTDGGKLGGEVEVDETYIGGKARNMARSQEASSWRHCPATTWLAGKIAVMGLLERQPQKGKSKIRLRGLDEHSALPVARTRLRQRRDRDRLSTPMRFVPIYGLGTTEFVHNVIDHAECIRRWAGSHQRLRELLEPVEASPEGHLCVRGAVSFVQIPR